MAKSVDINLDLGSDDDDARDDDISIDYEGMPEPSGPLFNPVPKTREQELEEKRQQRQREKDREKEIRDRYRDELSAVRRQYQERADKEREAYSQQMAQSRSNITDLRSQSVGTRVGAYSLASALGLKGYVTASIADAMYIRPKEEEATNAQKDYQKALQREQNEYKSILAKERELKEQWIRQKQAAELAANKQPPDNRSPLEKLLYGDQPPSGGGSGGPRDTSGGGGSPPSSPPVGRGNPPNNPPGGGGSPPVQPTIPPVPASVVPDPPLIPPVPPNLGGMALPLQIVTAAIEAARRINQSIDDISKATSNTLTAAVKGDGSSASRGIIKGARALVDPLGVNIPVQVAVSGFNTLLDLNESILESLRKNIEFAPQSLEADVTGDIQKMLAQIQQARELDPITAELIRANTQFDLAWIEFRGEIIRRFTPEIIGLLKTMSVGIKVLPDLLEVIANMDPALALAMNFLSKIADNTTAEEDDLKNVGEEVFKDLEKFFDPANNLKEHRAALRQQVGVPILP